MKQFDSTRRATILSVSLGALLAATGCVSVPGRDVPAPVWYVLDDPGAGRNDGKPDASGRKIAATVLVGPVSASSFDDSLMLSYGRTTASRAHYQFAGWTERPAKRIGLLVERRLARGSRFDAVAQGTSGVRADLLLNLHLEHFFHDLSTSPGRARVALVAELVDWPARRLLGRRRFDASVPLGEDVAAVAARGLGDALAAVLDQMCPWVEKSAQSGSWAGVRR